jgi:DNA-binding HxlR family transcriptional regulator
VCVGYLGVTFGRNIELTKNPAEKYLAQDRCPVRNVLDRFGDKWSILVLLSLDESGTLRFTELLKSIGDVSQKMLTVTLRTLEADGLVLRKLYPEIPPRVEYSLTPRGKTLMPHIHHLAKWAMENMPAIQQSRKQHAA